MNKFFAIAVLACVCAVASATSITNLNEEMPSEFSFVTTDSDEVAQLPASLHGFEDFCLSSRDYVLSDVKSSTNRLTSNVFSIFFTSAEDVGKEAMDTNREATDKLSKQLAQPASPVDADSDNEIDQIIANGQSKIAGQNQPLALITAFKTVFSATSTKVGALVSQRFDMLKKYASLEQVGSSLADACDMVKHYEDSIREQLVEYKAQALNNDAKFEHLTLDDVPCATARRIVRVEGACKFVMALKPTVTDYFGRK